MKTKVLICPYCDEPKLMPDFGWHLQECYKAFKRWVRGKDHGSTVS